MISLTASARQHVNKVLAEASADLFRIALSQKGCSGYAYNMSVHSISQLDELILADDIVMECDGVKIAVPAKDIDHLTGAQLDWVQDGFSSRLLVINPHVKNACGCGASVMF